MCLVFSLFTTLPLSSFPTPFTVFIVLSIVCTGVGWKCLDFDTARLRILTASGVTYKMKITMACDGGLE